MVNNILSLIQPGLQVQPGNGVKPAETGMFPGLLAGVAGLSGTGQTPQLAPADAALLAEKIAALLNGTAIPAQQITATPAQPAQPQAQKPAAVTGIVPTLTQDLSAPVAQDVQTQAAESAVVPVTPDAADVAQATPTLQPEQSLLETINTTLSRLLSPETPVAPQETVVTADPAIPADQIPTTEEMAAFAAALNTIEPQAGAVATTPAIPAATPVDAAPQMQNAPVAPVVLPAAQPRQPQAQAQPQMPAQDAAQSLPQMAAQADTSPDENALMQFARKMPAASTEQPQTATPAQAAPAQNAPAAKPATPATLIQTMLQNGNADTDAQTGGFSQGGFGHSGFGGGFDSASQGMTTTVDAAAQGFAQYTAAAAGRALPAHTTQMIAVQMQRNAAAKIDTFTLQLDPADLGRLDIRMKFSRDGSMKAHLSADRPETLAMLQRDAGQLERVLQDAGVDIDGDSLSFDLRQHSQNDNLNGARDHDNTAGNSRGDNENTGSDAAEAAATTPVLQGYIRPNGVNITV